MSVNSKVVQQKIRFQSLSKAVDLLEVRSAYVLCEIKNCGRWSDLIAVMVPEIMPFEIILLKIMSGFWNHLHLD